MRVSLLVTVVAIALAGCGGRTPSPSPTPTAAPTPSPSPTHVTIGIHLHRQVDPPRKCLATLDDSSMKTAVVYTGFQVIWPVTKNECGDLQKITKKALGLKFLKHQSDGRPAKWFKDCSVLNSVPARSSGPLSFGCLIPDKTVPDVLGLYEYEIDGDSVEPQDPGLDVRPGR